MAFAAGGPDGGGGGGSGLAAALSAITRPQNGQVWSVAVSGALQREQRI
jgi:hypothetical protein